ncbi:MAG: type II toxin-antitoxin system HicA family toxin [Muribaculaceae bacterium]|jgi:predicted RNA binding protein YcfA (HicA-like mRNA interferase family)|nr:type II toxin-antitoxin system HicA family toxin [Muribaculaceae bacterium]MDE6392440.1 type II toxin-antitoxin system HicA family toxin [Muribaculaceae bacterium]
MKWSELIKIAEAHGYKFVGHGKKHDRYRNPETGDTIMVERHGSQEIRKGLYLSLKKRIGF